MYLPHEGPEITVTKQGEQRLVGVGKYVSVERRVATGTPEIFIHIGGRFSMPFGELADFQKDVATAHTIAMVYFSDGWNMEFKDRAVDALNRAPWLTATQLLVYHAGEVFTPQGGK